MTAADRYLITSTCSPPFVEERVARSSHSNSLAFLTCCPASSFGRLATVHFFLRRSQVRHSGLDFGTMKLSIDSWAHDALPWNLTNVT